MISQLEIGPEIDPGVPALRAGPDLVVVALKSGNFGGKRLFRQSQYGFISFMNSENNLREKNVFTGQISF